MALPFRFTEPKAPDFEAALALSDQAPFSYPDVGASRGRLPEGWIHDEAAGEVGRGEAQARRAFEGLRTWVMFDLGWIRPYRFDVPQEPGALFAFAGQSLGLVTLNVCRVVYRIDEDDGVVARCGFAYGTLGGHAVMGEEQFLVTWDRRTDRVVFSIRKFSRPNHRLFEIGLPILREVQKRFSDEAIARLARFVAAP